MLDRRAISNKIDVVVPHRAFLGSAATVVELVESKQEKPLKFKIKKDIKRSRKQVSEKNHNWVKEQPHDAKTGEITSRDYAEKHPSKVEWVKVKTPKRK